MPGARMGVPGMVAARPATPVKHAGMSLLRPLLSHS